MNNQPWWNLIITVRKDGFKDAKRALRHYGTIGATQFFNVLVAHVDNLSDFFHDFSQEFLRHPFLQDRISRITPLLNTFTFDSKKDFETKIKEIITPWIPRLKEKSFYVRIHSRGVQELSTLEEEQFLDRFILQNSSAHVSFKNPDFIIDVETIKNEAGVSIWTASELREYPFINLD
ncbi:MAG: THUMP domain-containing protein [Bacteriovoracaceae bacterium]|nr:THUMP domain-containing protein [Bacteriovoracaceae bacterium]